ncbi:MAG: hypothetical protein Q8Q12_00575 [bacterium]|nr:hypothetical protein [bacterium]
MENLQATIDQSVESILTEKRKRFPSHVNRCSQLGDPCERRLFYHRTAWDQAKGISTGLAGIFETGTELEPLVERHLSEIGGWADPQFRIIGQQQATRDDLFDAHKISGRVDGFLQILKPEREGHLNSHWQTLAVVDIKTCNPNVFESLDGVDSLGAYSWTSRYRAQLMLYALAHNLDQCLLIFVNKSNLWSFKTISFPLDFAYAESLIQKADRINVAVESGVPPVKLNRPDECGRCEYAHICLPELIGTGTLEFCMDPELEDLLIEREPLLEPRRRADQIDKLLGKRLVPGKDLAVGKFLIQWEQRHRKETVIPASDYWQKKVTAVNGEPGQEG